MEAGADMTKQQFMSKHRPRTIQEIAAGIGNIDDMPKPSRQRNFKASRERSLYKSLMAMNGMSLKIKY